MGIRWGFGKSFDVSPKRWVIQIETVLLQQSVLFFAGWRRRKDPSSNRSHHYKKTVQR